MRIKNNTIIILCICVALFFHIYIVIDMMNKIQKTKDTIVQKKQILENEKYVILEIAKKIIVFKPLFSNELKNKEILDEFNRIQFILERYENENK